MIQKEKWMENQSEIGFHWEFHKSYGYQRAALWWDQQTREKKSITSFLIEFSFFCLRFVWFRLPHDESCERTWINTAPQTTENLICHEHGTISFKEGYHIDEAGTTPETLCFHHNNIMNRTPVGWILKANIKAAFLCWNRSLSKSIIDLVPHITKYMVYRKMCKNSNNFYR